MAQARRLLTASLIIATACLGACGSEREPEPARSIDASLSGEGDCPLSENVMADRSVWYASGDDTPSDERQLYICTGSVAYQRSTGLISLQRMDGPTSGSRLIKRPRSGSITITNAPEGTGLPATRLRHGVLELRTESGATGFLQLEGDISDAWVTWVYPRQ